MLSEALIVRRQAFVSEIRQMFHFAAMLKAMRFVYMTTLLDR